MEPNTGLIVTGAQGSAKIYKVSTLKRTLKFRKWQFFYGPRREQPDGHRPCGRNIRGDRFVYLPYKYVDNTPLPNTATYYSATFAALGVTPGTYIWTWGSGADQSFTLKIVQTPPPDTLRLLGLLGWRRKRKA